MGFSGWADEELAWVTANVLILLGDHDFVTIEHAALELERIPGARLAAVPSATHFGLMHRTGIVQDAHRFSATGRPTPTGPDAAGAGRGRR